MGLIPFLPEVIVKGNTWALWKIYIRVLAGRRINPSVIRRRAVSYSIYNILQYSYEDTYIKSHKT